MDQKALDSKAVKLLHHITPNCFRNRSVDADKLGMVARHKLDDHGPLVGVTMLFAMRSLPDETGPGQDF